MAAPEIVYACSCCLGTALWRLRAGGPLVCARCHPPLPPPEAIELVSATAGPKTVGSGGLGVWFDPGWSDEDHPGAEVRPFRSALELFDYMRQGVDEAAARTRSVMNEKITGDGHNQTGAPSEDPASIIRGIFGGRR
jgi:hypothetical protein